MKTFLPLPRVPIVAPCLLFILIQSTTAICQNVGIGTNNPVYKLHVAGSIRSDEDLRVGGFGWIADNLSIGNVTPSPAFKLRVAGGKTWADELTAGGPGYTGKILSVYGDAQFNQNVLAQSLNLTSDGIVDGNFRINGRIGINGATNGSYGLYVNNANSYLQGNLSVANDAIVDGNLRTNGRVGINGATNGSYGLYVNNSNSYFQGSIATSGNVAINGNTSIAGTTTVLGNTNLQGPVTIQGNGSVRSNGSSALRISYHNYSFHYDVGGNQTKTVNVPISAFSSTSDVRVMICQVISTGSANDPESIPHFTWWVSKVDPANNTCSITVRNHSGLSKLLSVHFELAVIYRD